MMRNYTSLAALAATALLAACGQNTDTGETAPDAGAAQRIATGAIVVDTHIDVPYRLMQRPDDVSQATEGGDFDYPRAVAGGLDAAFMSIYTPARLEAEGTSFDVAEELIDMTYAIVENAPDKFAVALSVDDVRRNKAAG